MNYGDYKTHEMAYNLKELPTFGDRLKNAQMKQLEKKLTDFYQSIKLCCKDSKSNDQKGEESCWLKFYERGAEKSILELVYRVTAVNTFGEL